jgi:hypothetical protein
MKKNIKKKIGATGFWILLPFSSCSLSFLSLINPTLYAKKKEEDRQKRKKGQGAN